MYQIDYQIQNIISFINLANIGEFMIGYYGCLNSIFLYNLYPNSYSALSVYLTNNLYSNNNNLGCLYSYDLINGSCVKNLSMINTINYTNTANVSMAINMTNITNITNNNINIVNNMSSVLLPSSLTSQPQNISNILKVLNNA